MFTGPYGLTLSDDAALSAVARSGVGMIRAVFSTMAVEGVENVATAATPPTRSRTVISNSI